MIKANIMIDITLITPAETRSALESALKTNPSLTGLPSPKAEVIAPEDLTLQTGTGDLLRLPAVQKAIVSDFIILPCDLVSELDGARLVQQWMTLNPLSAAPSGGKRKGGLALFYPTHGLEGISHKKDETDFIATVPLQEPPLASPNGSLRPNIETLVSTMPRDTLNDKMEDANGVFQVRAQLAGKYGRVKLKMKHRDAHVYIFPHWVKDLAARNEKAESISEDILGWWAKAQWQKGFGQKLGLDEVLGQRPSSPADMESSQIEEDNADASALSSTKVSFPGRPAQSTAFASRVGKSAPTAITTPSLDIPPLHAYVQPVPTGSNPQALIRRVDNPHALLNVSLHLAKQQGTHALAHEHKIHPTAILGQQSRVAQEDSLVAENVKVGMRSNIKESVIGANCDIGANVRLTKCLLMDGVTVGDGVQMVGCIVGRRAKIEGMKSEASTGVADEERAEKKKGKKGGDDEDRTKLTDCEVAPNYVVEAGTEAKGSQMMVFETENMDDLMDDGGEA